MGSLSPLHWLVVIVVVLVLFAPKRLTELARGIGKSATELKKGMTEETPEEKE